MAPVPVGYRDLVSARLATDATPIRVTVTVFPSDRNQIVYDVGTVPEHREEPVKP